ncbi:DUF6478 family protein [Ruegeria sp.]|uniref:DUF6478 family protein n=1 Tax=Ruegeria sp. TaxID=1879320 RepID=UPI002310B1E4|nr:DUF6478 family protein [Ruegeria sp.]MDA7963523.1 DUF6478 family protein [Ruegeria sp.]
MGGILDRYLNRKVLARWQRAGQQADSSSLSELRRQRDNARQLRAQLDRLIQRADARLTRPLIGSSQFPRPLGTDWSWRPDLWRGPLARQGLASAPRKAALDGQVTLFHDCDLAEIVLRQTRNRRDNDLAPYSLMAEVLEFNGSFLSLSIELPSDGATGLTGQHLMRIDTVIEAERPIAGFVRLNIQHGPNTEQVLRELDMSTDAVSVDFDLAHLELNERRIEKVWLDVIFNNPAMNRITLRDLTFCRHHRADM